MRKLPVILLLIPVVLLLLGCSKSVDNNDEPSERQLNKFSEGSAGYFYNPPTIVNSYLYIGTSRGCTYDVATDNYFFKTNMNLKKVWGYPLGTKEVRGGATLDIHGNIYFIVMERDNDYNNVKLDLYSLSNNADFRWSRELFSTTGMIMGMSNPAITINNIIYAGGDKLYAFDTLGSELWTYGSNLHLMNAPIIDPSGNIYFNSPGYIISTDKDGVERWKTPTNGGECYSSPAFSTDYSKIYVGVYNEVYCINAISGSIVWVFTQPSENGSFRASPAVDNENNVYIGTHGWTNSMFYAIKANGSGVLWQRKIGADLYSSPALGDDNTIYVGSEFTDTGDRKRFYALDMTTGKTKWSAYFGTDPTFSSSAITDNGTLYIATITVDLEYGAIYALRTDCTGLLSNAGWPRFHGGNANTGRKE